MNQNDKHQDKDLQKRVGAWLEKTGYPLEMRVARDFFGDHTREWNISPNWYYHDKKSGEYREIDLFADWMSHYRGAIVWWFTLVVECKSTGNPWIIFKEHTQSDRNLVPLFDPTAWCSLTLTNADPPNLVDRPKQALAATLRKRCPLYPEPQDMRSLKGSSDPTKGT